ncbi:phosphatase PAP2 family protein [Oribacterium sp. WCC10]|uniref:phosphatase PAP2 family protein n=1 Tax=Oribacterium sp. WCC10 TaxID=1855343 RepID=UPI0008EEE40A|nr:phosphatase PAP2 family protein [Oribacterium sp. WCC10]SFG45112.1 PAP2 superfamily protein [Oribacterium sp. WCC10]
MDIQYLLWLQELRNATGGVFDEFFNGISKVAVDLMPFLPFFIFWCVDKKWGHRFLVTFGISGLLNGIIKLTVCAYRPWIRSDLIEPAGDSKVAATGYSFPSGHTTEATAVYGTVFSWQKKTRRWLAVLSGVLIALTGFSRNFLGVHTPQDVVVGFTVTLISILVIGRAQERINGDERKLDNLSFAGLLVIIGTLIYIMLKPYPMDYVDGVLLVDPNKMMNDTFKACGAFTGFLAGSYVERHFIHYEIPFGSKNLPILGFAGFLITYSWKEYFAPATIVAALGGHWGHFISRFIMWFFVMAVWPIVITKFSKCEKQS